MNDRATTFDLKGIHLKGIHEGPADHRSDAEGDGWIDHEAIAWCSRAVKGKEIPSLEEVRQALAKITGSMAQAVIEERGERF